MQLPLCRHTQSSRPLTIATVAAVVVLATVPIVTQSTPGPQMLHPQLAVRTVVSGLVTPTTMAFLGEDDVLVLEKNTGRVKRVIGGVVQATVLDLGVNWSSERGLLGIALHPEFPDNPGVYLFWTCPSLEPPEDPFFPDQ